MTNIHLHECRMVCISAHDDVVANLCANLGINGYLFEEENRLTLIASKIEAEKLDAALEDRAFIRDLPVRVKQIPDGIKRLIRKKVTASRGGIDGWESGGKIWGWFPLDRTAERKFSIFQGDDLFVEACTDIFRPDLFEAGVGNGVAGFICPCPVIKSGSPIVTLKNTAGVNLATISPHSQTKVSSSHSIKSRPVNVLPLGEMPEPNASGHYSASLGGFSLDYFVSTGTTDKMIVFSPGFLDTGRFPYPYFQRMKWAKKFDETCIFLADPTLLLGNTQIGWFVGDKKTHYLPTVAGYVSDLAKSRSISPQNITFFGSSAGGFSSIGFAAHVRGSRALAVNPQTNGLKLHSPSQLSNTLRSCLGLSDLSEAYLYYGDRFILTEMFRKLNNVPRLTVWQNFYDRYHVEHHLLPFLNELQEFSPTEEVEVHMAARPEDGHDPPDLPAIRKFFR